MNPLFELAYASNGWVVRKWMPIGECDEYGTVVGTHEVVVFGTDRDVKECFASVLVHASRRPDTPDKPPKQPSKV
jgi:hypothetical protein